MANGTQWTWNTRSIVKLAKINYEDMITILQDGIFICQKGWTLLVLDHKACSNISNRGALDYMLAK